MKLARAALALLLIAAAVPATAQAQSAATAKPFWLHISAAPEYWVNDLQEDPDADGATAGYNPLGFVLGEPGVAEWVIPFTPALSAPLPLDTAGSMVSTIFVGGNSAAGRVTLTSELRLGSTVVATGTAGAATVYSAGYQKVEITAPVKVPSFDPSIGDATWVVQAEGFGAQIFLAADEARPTGFTLPVTGGSTAGPQHHVLTGDVAEIALAPSSAANATHVYNWTTSLTALQLTVAGDRNAGNASILVRDGGNQTVHETTFGEPSQANLTGAAGNWSIEVVLQGFAGNLSIRLGAPGATGSGGPGTTPGSPSSGTGAPKATGSPTATDAPAAGGNETADADEEDAPAPGLLPLLGALAAAAVVLRRRR